MFFFLIQAPVFLHYPREVKQIFDSTQTLRITNHDQHLILVTTPPPYQLDECSCLGLGAGAYTVLLKMLLLPIQASFEVVKIHCKGFAATSLTAIQKRYGQKVGLHQGTSTPLQNTVKLFVPFPCAVPPNQQLVIRKIY